MEREPAPHWFHLLRRMAARVVPLLALCASLQAGGVSARADAAPVPVALFSEPGCTDERSREAAWRVLSGDPRLAAERATTASLAAGQLGRIRVLVIPGGTAGGIARSLGVDGGTTVTRFVREGGGLIGICAGGYLVMPGWTPETRAIELVNATSWDSENWARGEGFIAVEVPGTTPGSAATSHTMWFENGPIFAPGDPFLPGYGTLVRYVTDMAKPGAPTGMMTGRDAAVAARFGRGRVVAFGPHPELSPGLGHWLVNAALWAAAPDDGASTPTAAAVLGRAD